MHLELLADRYVRAGISPAEGRPMARASSAGSRSSRNRSATRWGFQCSNRSSTTRATRCGGLVRAKGFAAVSVLTLAFGLGVSTTSTRGSC